MDGVKKFMDCWDYSEEELLELVDLILLLKKAKKMAAAMLKDGMEPDKVKKYSELSEEQWNDLLKSLSD